jgi:hypothetical protein
MMLKDSLRTGAALAATLLLVTGAVALGFPGSGATRTDAPPKSEAQTIAEKFLKAGSALFNAKDAAGLAATYAENGEILLIGKKDGEVTEDVKDGRAEVEKFYADYFHEKGAIDSENTIELARLIAPDLLVVHGRFRPNVGEDELPFVQLRVKQGDRWLLSKLWLFLSHK